MTDSEILLAVVEKAVRGGWEDDISQYGWVNFDEYDLVDHVLYFNQHYSLLFDHCFLKAYFGEEDLSVSDRATEKHITPETDPYYPAWQYYAQKLVLAEDRLEYLKNHL